jgi:hypothetical protein
MSRLLNIVHFRKFKEKQQHGLEHETTPRALERLCERSGAQRIRPASMEMQMQSSEDED